MAKDLVSRAGKQIGAPDTLKMGADALDKSENSDIDDPFEEDNLDFGKQDNPSDASAFEDSETNLKMENYDYIEDIVSGSDA